jgi:hypothetical protein
VAYSWARGSLNKERGNLFLKAKRLGLFMEGLGIRVLDWKENSEIFFDNYSRGGST